MPIFSIKAAPRSVTASCAEARGSFAAKASDAKMASEAQRKHLRQVRPYIGAASPHGQVIHGYSIAFGARPGIAGAFLQLSQTLRPRAKPTKPPMPVPASGASNPVLAAMALATHRSNFILMDALQSPAGSTGSMATAIFRKTPSR